MDLDIKEFIKAASEGLNLKDFKGDVVGVKVVENQIGNIEPGGIGIQNVYSSAKKKAATQNKEREKKPVGKPKTLKYYRHGNNGILMKQRKRVDIVFRKWNEWGWIDDSTSPDDFDAFFEGEPRHCNIAWMTNTTILTILMQELLKQPYIEKQTGCSAKSLVEHQFEKTPNSDKTRLDADSEEKINLTLLILDIQNPLPEGRGRNHENEFDIKDEALREIYAGKLRSTKGI